MRGVYRPGYEKAGLGAARPSGSRAEPGLVRRSPAFLFPDAVGGQVRQRSICSRVR
jgi:hypothetical protein